MAETDLVPAGEAAEQGLVDVAFAMQEWEAYQALTRSLLNASDYQKIGKSSFKKKSAWRKYARAFNLSSAVVKEEIERDTDHFPLFARVVVRTTDPKGRFQEGDQECHVFERCCPTRNGQRCNKASWESHYCCTANCDGKVHFSHPGDLIAIATTRAKNRSISDLIGAGEVSAEEMSDEPAAKPAPQKRAPAKAARPVEAEVVTPTGTDATVDQELAKLRYQVRAALMDAIKDEMERVAWMEKHAPSGVVGSNLALDRLTAEDAENALAEIGNYGA